MSGENLKPETPNTQALPDRSAEEAKQDGGPAGAAPSKNALKKAAKEREKVP